MSNFHKELISTCDDEMFMCGEIKISWRSKDQNKKESLRYCKLELDLQYGNIAILRVEEVEALIENLKTVKDRLS